MKLGTQAVKFAYCKEKVNSFDEAVKNYCQTVIGVNCGSVVII
jgi:hypothetical protein